ncbi:MAG: hypothetical protein WKG07_00405 [Hymenobacter sp.]
MGAAVPVRLLVGENFAGETWARPTRRVLRFVRLGPTPSILGPAPGAAGRPPWPRPCAAPSPARTWCCLPAGRLSSSCPP